MRTLATFAVILALTGSSSPARDLSALFTPPVDTADAERVRIWLPLERTTVCRASVVLFDSTGGLIRTLIDTLLPGGYLNLYWDKRDDSGHYVPAGTYYYRVRDCQAKFNGELTALYLPGERESYLVWLGSDSAAHFDYGLSRDSLKVSMAVFNKRGRQIGEIFRDSLYQAGNYRLTWAPPPAYAGDFVLVMTVGEYRRTQPFTVPPSPRRPRF